MIAATGGFVQRSKSLPRVGALLWRSQDFRSAMWGRAELIADGDLQGEHMIFLGSKKYPGEAEFEEFLSENGGESNAYTECEYTCYLIECLANLKISCLPAMLAKFNACQHPLSALLALRFLFPCELQGWEHIEAVAARHNIA